LMRGTWKTTLARHTSTISTDTSSSLWNSEFECESEEECCMILLVQRDRWTVLIVFGEKRKDLAHELSLFLQILRDVALEFL